MGTPKPIKDILGADRKPRTTWGGKRNGSGSYLGRKNKATLERDILAEEIKNRVIRAKDALINSQMNLALGCQYLYVIETIEVKEGNKKIMRKQKPRRVTNQSVIESYLAGELDDKDDEYYFLTTDKPDNKALDSLIDRVAGRAKQSIELSGSLNIDNVLERLNK